MNEFERADSGKTIIVYVFRRSDLRTPLLVAFGLISYVLLKSDWFALIGLPFIYLGWMGSAPNLNLAEGCLPNIVTILALGIGVWLQSTALMAIGIGCWVTWFTASIEAGLRQKPMSDYSAEELNRE
jgi:hypothetical protein